MQQHAFGATDLHVQLIPRAPCSHTGQPSREPDRTRSSHACERVDHSTGGAPVWGKQVLTDPARSSEQVLLFWQEAPVGHALQSAVNKGTDTGQPINPSREVACPEPLCEIISEMTAIPAQ